MDNNILLSMYELSKCISQKIYSAGPDMFFCHPCIGYVKKGYAKFFYEGKTLYAYEGDLIYISSGTRYQSIWFGSPDIEWYSIGFEFNSKYAFCDYRFQIIKNYSSDLIEKMYETYEEKPMESVSYFYLLLNDIYKKMENTPKPLLYITIKPAVEYIEKNFSQPVSIKFISNLCHMSESGFYKLFKKATGVTPIAYKHNIMIQQAIELLSSSSVTIEEISAVIGFPSSNYFRKVFFRITGKTPKELRKK